MAFTEKTINDIATLQKFIRTYYAKPDDYSKALLWLYEEVGELAEGMLNKDKANQMEELPQNVVWLLSFANGAGLDVASCVKATMVEPKGEKVATTAELSKPAIRFIPTEKLAYGDIEKTIVEIQKAAEETYGVLDARDNMLNYVTVLGTLAKGVRKGDVEKQQDFLGKAFIFGVMQANSLGINLAKSIEQAVAKYMCDYGNAHHGAVFATRADILTNGRGSR